MAFLGWPVACRVARGAHARVPRCRFTLVMERVLPGDGGPGPTWPASVLRLARFYLTHPQSEERARRALSAGAPALGLGEFPHPGGSGRRYSPSHRPTGGGMARTRVCRKPANGSPATVTGGGCRGGAASLPPTLNDQSGRAPSSVLPTLRSHQGTCSG